MSVTNAKLLYLHALSPVHSGTGQTAAVIDQPIAREKATGWPMIPGSSLKGVLRDSYQNKLIQSSKVQGQSFEEKKKAAEEEAKKIFGDEDRAGPLCFADQRILCFPVRSYLGTFAYVTCAHVLNRLKRDMEAIGIPAPIQSRVLVNPPDPQSILLPKDNSILANSKVYLEDLDLNVSRQEEIGTIAGELAAVLFSSDMAAFTSRFAVVSDEVFNFLCETATEIQARVALEENTKTVRSGGLWYEEAVPAETIFCGPVLVADHYRSGGNPLDDLKPIFTSDKPVTLQIGGNASIGRGLCRVVMP